MMKKLTMMAAALFVMGLVAVSCENESVSEIEETYSPDPDKVCPVGNPNCNSNIGG